MWPYYYEANYLPYLEAAKDLINQGYWSQEFVGKGIIATVYKTTINCCIIVY